jgi:hypothetical protein
MDTPFLQALFQIPGGVIVCPVFDRRGAALLPGCDALEHF